ncbi:iron chaperone [Variovorax sp. OV329]|uniref:iron chaperone n=1 Tax=Variovorax sp. OV329 TaxID=1882825 RepID=UPI0008E5B0BB|nr:DUF1801 domain-containing protein [Variovorax sp. OV329]SFN19863.1 Uncharacterized conserved protein YdhG, YjbR/CyaY-like superfamily, DUF1801 family [Variovorax sp. OV329]
MGMTAHRSAHRTRTAPGAAAPPIAVPANIDEYISGFAPATQALLEQVRQAVHAAAPDAREVISYRIPAFKAHGILVYFAAFKKHIGFYPPVRGSAELEEAVAPYAGEKGNLRFAMDRPLPLELIDRITRLRLQQDQTRGGPGKRH